MHGLGLIRGVAAFVHDSQRSAEAFGVCAGAFHTTCIRRDDNEIIVTVAQVIKQNRSGEQVVHRTVEEALNLTGVQVTSDQSLHACGGQHVGHELGGNRGAGHDLAVLTSVTEIGNHGGDTGCAGSLESVEHQAEFHEVEVHWRAGGLNDKYIVAAYVFTNFNSNFTIGKAFAQYRRRLGSQMLANGFCQSRAGRTADDFKLAVHVNPLT